MNVTDPLSLAFTDLQTYEDAEQARTLAHPPVVLPYDSDTGLVISGPWAGSDVDALAEAMIRGHLHAGQSVVYSLGFRRPWWRLWKRTPVVQITVQAGEA